MTGRCPKLVGCREKASIREPMLFLSCYLWGVPHRALFDQALATIRPSSATDVSCLLTVQVAGFLCLFVVTLLISRLPAVVSLYDRRNIAELAASVLFSLGVIHEFAAAPCKKPLHPLPPGATIQLTVHLTARLGSPASSSFSWRCALVIASIVKLRQFAFPFWEPRLLRYRFVLHDGVHACTLV